MGEPFVTIIRILLFLSLLKYDMEQQGKDSRTKANNTKLQMQLKLPDDICSLRCPKEKLSPFSYRSPKCTNNATSQQKNVSNICATFPVRGSQSEWPQQESLFWSTNGDGDVHINDFLGIIWGFIDGRDSSKSVQIRCLSFTYETREVIPSFSHVQVKEIAEAGLFSTRQGDETICFYCGLILRNWERGDDPLVIHTMCSPNCDFLKKTTGSEFISAVQKAVSYIDSTDGKTKCVQCKTEVINWIEHARRSCDCFSAFKIRGQIRKDVLNERMRRLCYEISVTRRVYMFHTFDVLMYFAGLCRDYEDIEVPQLPYIHREVIAEEHRSIFSFSYNVGSTLLYHSEITSGTIAEDDSCSLDLTADSQRQPYDCHLFRSNISLDAPIGMMEYRDHYGVMFPMSSTSRFSRRVLCTAPIRAIESMPLTGISYSFIRSILRTAIEGAIISMPETEIANGISFRTFLSAIIRELITMPVLESNTRPIQCIFRTSLITAIESLSPIDIDDEQASASATSSGSISNNNTSPDRTTGSQRQLPDPHSDRDNGIVIDDEQASASATSSGSISNNNTSPDRTTGSQRQLPDPHSDRDNGIVVDEEMYLTPMESSLRVTRIWR